MQNGVKFIQKLTPDFKNHMRNLDNFRQAVESPKSWNSMGYTCPKNTFLQLTHYIQRSYPPLLSTTYVKIHQIPYVIFETLSHFSRQLNCIVLAQALHTFEKNILSKCNISDFSLLELNSSNFSCHFSNKKWVFKIWITLQCHEG